ncbi:penicillin acylase family protein [Nonomuraea dietziae]|uniref:penicillin acylase family protein n=1 Tax=Nonomuraea dietziae TaxID=65515 RepID=UPI0031CEBD76
MGTEEHDGIGSNSWVVSGEHTTTGKPLLANDPHLSAQMPSVWYQAGLHCRTESDKCGYDVTGFTLLRRPRRDHRTQRQDRVVIHHLGPDVADLFLEQVKGDTYLYRGQWPGWRPGTSRSRSPAARRSPSRCARPGTDR